MRTCHSMLPCLARCSWFAYHWTITTCLITFIYSSIFAGHSLTEGFVLEGSERSYVRFPKWYHAFENLLTFDFKTRQPYALLLYTDDGGRGNFYELSLVDGYLQLNFKVGRQEPRQRVPRRLEIYKRRFNDGQWHKVELYHFWENVRLKVDEIAEDERLETQQDFVFGKYETNSDVFVGGLPPDYAPDRLSSPTSQKVMHFAGEFRNLVYRTLPHGITSPHLLQIEGARETADDYCQKEHCRNGGLCYSTDNGPKCNCNYTDFIGDQCMSERHFREATFFGGEYLVYDLTENRNGFMSREEHLSFRFRTRRLSGMIFYCGDQTDYLHVALKEGALVVTSNVGGGSLAVKASPSEMDFYSNKTVFAPKFNDNAWHSAVVHRRLKKLSVAVDDAHYDIQDLPGHFDQLTGTLVYIGGTPPSPINQLSRFPQVLETSNFVGCLTKVRFNVSGRIVDFLELATSEPEQSAFLRVYGNLSYDSCRDKHAPEPISFLDSDSYYLLSLGWRAPRQGSISFKFRTNEPDGLLLYNGPKERNQSDFIAFELLDGQLYFVLNLGSGALRLQATAQTVNDYRWHTVTVHRDGREGRVTIDHASADFSTPGKARRLDLGDSLYIGGIPWISGDYTASPSLHTVTLRRGYIGCVRDLRLNGLIVDLLSSGNVKTKSARTQLGCINTLSLCSSGPCKNDGLCRDGYNRYACDCSPTFYEGDTCEAEPVLVEFQSGQFVRYALGETVKSEAEDVSVKFRTLKPSGLLMAASLKKALPSVELRLSNGVLEYQIHLGKSSRPFFWGASLNDDRWHTAKIKRRARRLELFVDAEDPVIGEIPSPLTILQYDQLWAGHIPGDGPASTFSSMMNTFDGQMAAFRFNHYDVFELASSGSRRQSDNEQRRRHNAMTDSGRTKSTAYFSDRKLTYDNPVAFFSRGAHIALPENDSAAFTLETYQLFFQFRTFEANGLLMFSGSSRTKDFVAVELMNGKLRYIFNTGDGPQTLQGSTDGHFNDFKWHQVLIRKRGSDHALTVDNSTVRLRKEGSTRDLNLDGQLYFGGADASSYRRMLSAVSARHGFKGCIASVEIDGAKKHLLNDAVTRVDAASGCQEPTALCQLDHCENGGLCIQQANGVRCDCSLTTFTGPKCNEGSVSYKFGPGPGIIKFRFNDNEVLSRSNDVFVVGLRTNQTSEAIILRADSQSSGDYLYLELVDGCAAVVYDVGSGAHRIGDLTHKINDNRYHVVKFTRSGPNATFQLDSFPMQVKYYHRQPELEVFNNQYQLQIGGRYNPTYFDRSPSIGVHSSKSSFSRHGKRRSLRNKVERPFNGIVSGLYFNQIMPLDLSSKRDPRIKIDGEAVMHAWKSTPRSDEFSDRGDQVAEDPLANWNVPPNPHFDYLSRKELNDRMIMTSSVEPASRDELLTPNEEGGSGRCAGEDGAEDDGCIVEPPSPTDLISPVFTRAVGAVPTAAPPPRNTAPNVGPTSVPKPCYPNRYGECEDTPVEESIEAQVEVLLPQLSTLSPIRPAPATRPAHPTRTTPAGPPTPAPTQPANRPVLEGPKGQKAARPTVQEPGGAAGQSTSSTKLQNIEDEKSGFPKTVVISCVAIGLIVMLIVVVFLVFKCRHKTSSGESYSTVEETKQYTNLNTSTEQSAPAPEMTPSRSFINAKTTQTNGFSRIGKKKDVKEWYV